MELYKQYRPKILDDLVGQSTAIKALSTKIKNNKLPHVILLTGPSGCGKTTIARILKRELKCSKHDYKELNGATCGGVDDVRAIENKMTQAPINGKCKIIYIDESHKITSAGQDALLKMLEDTPKHVYFFLATTDPQKLKRTIKTRATEIQVKSLSEKDIISLCKNICNLEERKLPSVVLEKIAENCEGSARKSLVLLEQVIELTNEKEMLATISETTLEKESLFIARELFQRNPNWKKIATALKEIQANDVESVRYSILGYAKSILLNGGPLAAKASSAIDMFADNFYDSKIAGLANACYHFIND